MSIVVTVCHDKHVCVDGFAVQIFSALAYYNLLRMPLVLLPFFLTMFSQALVSLDRIRQFLILPELKTIAV